MNDLIYRNQAIEAISKLPVKVDDLGYTWMIAGDVLKQIDDIPSAEPEPKKGNWIIKEEDWRKQFELDECSECGFVTTKQYNFCPNCGADMW